MKKVILGLALTMSIASCSKDDDKTNSQQLEFVSVTNDTITKHNSFNEVKLDKPFKFIIYDNSLVITDNYGKEYTYKRTEEKTVKTKMGELSTYTVEGLKIDSNAADTYFVYAYYRNGHFVFEYANILYKGTILYEKSFHPNSDY